MKLLHWCTDSIARFIFSVLFLALCFRAGGYLVTHAVSYDVVNTPQMFLGNSISATQTTGITISPLTRNGLTVQFPVTSGAVLRFTSGSRVEDEYYTSATIASDKTVTLIGVTRDVCWNSFKSLAGCGGGQSFPKGTIVTLSTDARLFNSKANKDRGNAFTSSGAITFTGSGTLAMPVFTNTTIRDHNINGNVGQMACSTTDGLCYFSIGGVWNTFGTSTTANATEGSSGKVELATIAQQIARTGSNNGPLVLQAKYLTNSGAVRGPNNSLNAGRIPMLNSSGALSGSLGGLGTVNAQSGALLIGGGSGAAMTVSASANSGSYLRSNGRIWKAVTTLPGLTSKQYLSLGVSNQAGASSIQESAITFASGMGTGTIVANSLKIGDVIQIHGDYNSPAAAQIKFYMQRYGSGTNFLSFAAGSVSLEDLYMEGTVETIGASGTIRWQIMGVAANNLSYSVTSNGLNAATQTIDTTLPLQLRFTTTESAVNSNNFIQFFKLTVLKL